MSSLSVYLFPLPTEEGQLARRSAFGEAGCRRGRPRVECHCRAVSPDRAPAWGSGMPRIILDADVRSKLLDLAQPLELSDEAGRVLARLLPATDPSLYEGLEPHVSREE